MNTSPDPSSASIDWAVPLSAPCFGPDEEKAVAEVIRSGWWTSGPGTRALENEFATRIGARHAVAVANGTAALHLAHLALGTAPGVDVLTPSLTFVAAANCILHTGATPRFADVLSLSTPLVTRETLSRAVTPATRGICVMHYGGFPCPMDEITEFARARGLWLIEDAAHAPGASWAGVPCGRWGDVGCFSFFGNKNLTCAEGGMAVTDDDALAAHLRALRSHGMTSLTWDRFQGHSFSYDVTEKGFNCRMDDLRASLLRVQLSSLDRFNELRRERSRWYCELLSQNAAWTIPFEAHPGVSSHHLFVIVLAEGISRERIMKALRDQRIQSSVHYPPVHQFSYYRGLSPAPSDLGVTEQLGRRLLTLPLYPAMTREQVTLVCDVLRDCVSSPGVHD
jgi:dTDP-4-amino-4,6-dideoxygalactose transaminase